MITLTIPGSAVKPLNLAAASAAPKSHRGRLVTRLSNGEVKTVGRGQATFVDVPEGLVKELSTWVDEAREFATGETEKDALRRLRAKVSGLITA